MSAPHCLRTRIEAEAARAAGLLESFVEAMVELSGSEEASDKAIAPAFAPTFPALVWMLKVGSNSGVEQAARAVANLASASAESRDALREAGAIPALVKVLQKSGCVAGETYAAWALSTLACGNAINRDAIRDAGAILPLVRLLRQPSSGGVPTEHGTPSEAAEAALASLSTNSAENQDAIRQAGAIPVLVKQLQTKGGAEVATQAMDALATLSAMNIANNDAIREAGGIPALTARLHEGAQSECATKALGALINLSCSSTTNRDALRDAGAIPPLVEMLREVQPQQAAEDAACVLANLAGYHPANQDAIREAGAIPLLVHLLTVSQEAATEASRALSNLCANAANQVAIQEAGAVEMLVQVLAMGYCEVAQHAEHVLLSLMQNSMGAAGATLDAIAAGSVSLADFPTLQESIRGFGACQLQHAEAGEDVAALRAAIDNAASVGAADAETLGRARQRIDELAREAMRQAHRISLGIGSIEFPHDFCCPITLSKLRDPVVASDGNTYEREAIMTVLGPGCSKISPLTREPLAPHVFRNTALLRRIELYDEEMAQAAAAGAAAERTVAAAAVVSGHAAHEAITPGSKRAARTVARSSPAKRCKSGGEGQASDGEHADSDMVTDERYVWTPDVHARFEDAVGRLGLARAKPRSIRQLMGDEDEEGLPTRQSIQAHLEQYRQLAATK